MGVRSGEEYIESLRERKPRVYLEGESVEDIVGHPAFKTGISSCAVSYELANDPRWRELARVRSPLTDEEISRWTHIMRDGQDALTKTRLMQAMGEHPCPCHYRCITSDVLHAAWVISYDIDQRHNTRYHQNLLEIVKEAQRNDWIIGGGFVSPKGDRSKGPAQQQDPDMYLHLVERRGDGIVVRGAKAHSTAAPYTNMLCVFELQPLEDYFVGFFTPPDAEGIIFICRAGHTPRETREMENPLSSMFGGHLESMIVLDDAFVP